MKHLFFAIAMIATVASFGQGNRKSPHDTVSNANATVTYGRPYKNNRDVFGGLEKFGKVWRVGADEATTITFKKDVQFAGQHVAAGTYTLFAIPGEKEWTVILNGVLGQWGAYKYEENKEKNVARANVPVIKLTDTVEQLTISFAADNALVIAWDKTQVKVPLKF